MPNLTEAAILALRPGREMDRLVAIRALGWRWVRQDCIKSREWAYLCNPKKLAEFDPKWAVAHCSIDEPSSMELNDGQLRKTFSIDHAAAMEALEEYVRLHASEWRGFGTDTVMLPHGGHTHVSIFKPVLDVKTTVTADSADILGLAGLAFAVCRAILLSEVKR